MLLISSCDFKVSEPSHKAQNLSDLTRSFAEIELQIPESLSINQANIIRMDRKGLVYVAMIPEYLVGIFDNKGKFISTIGAQGFGPAELIRIHDFRIDPDGNIVLMDAITERISVFDSVGTYQWGFVPLAQNNMCFETMSSVQFVTFRRAFKEKSFHIQILERTNKEGIQLVRELLPSSDESIRNHMVATKAISANGKGWIVFTLLAAKDIKAISPTYELTEIPINSPEYKLSDTGTLIQRFAEKKTKGLTTELFKNSRVLSVGFVSDDIVAISFATGRFDETKFYFQFYSLNEKRAISTAFITKTPIYYLGHNYFGQWDQNLSRLAKETDFNNRLRVFRFEGSRL